MGNKNVPNKKKRLLFWGECLGKWHRPMDDYGPPVGDPGRRIHHWTTEENMCGLQAAFSEFTLWLRWCQIERQKCKGCSHRVLTGGLPFRWSETETNADERRPLPVIVNQMIFCQKFQMIYVIWKNLLWNFCKVLRDFYPRGMSSSVGFSCCLNYPAPSCQSIRKEPGTLIIYFHDWGQWWRQPCGLASRSIQKHCRSLAKIHPEHIRINTKPQRHSHQ